MDKQTKEKKVSDRYAQMLHQYIQHGSEDALYNAQQLSKSMIDKGVSPEEIVGFHIESIKKDFLNIQPEVLQSFDFLLEIMIGYGIQYREHVSLREKQIQLQSEIEIAAKMQQTLLPPIPSSIPSDLELGICSVAAKRMSGDYYHVFVDNSGYLCLAVADIIGKGIPAALCMSLIKYAIESLVDHPLDPHTLLSSINRVVEKNIDINMFVTMVYGTYCFSDHVFRYASAGHEPSLYYSAQDDQFYDLEAKGPVLGLTHEATYQEQSIEVQPNDIIILFTDGLTEIRVEEERFIERDEIKELFNEYKHLPAQEMADSIHKQLLKLSDFELQDDQTIVVIKRSA
ncbi:PP2C family protein-serine/threonine phosphatase [Bacillus horti]|uniref:Sigma-B regulation protein RsbU (Phosphoserine phosphatase) n=1 Tax=Caldalkalibacillus horti TaxID=77523 RepID=A0ABT9W4S8_9BACI|nr:PP2C family protein-serine/threonine phosphatase [Bacillus horti]MDQ0168261.1 sigma-B regulation protein RsbU (phosphoserine phosphatase) [Bacillus horti]